MNEEDVMFRSNNYKTGCGVGTSTVATRSGRHLHVNQEDVMFRSNNYKTGCGDGTSGFN